jgi:replicative DNA helicase
VSQDHFQQLPPQAIEAEESVLGGIILENKCLEAVAEIIQCDDFYRESHRLIYRAMLDLSAGKRPIDAITLTAALRPVLEQVGGAARIAELAECVPTAAYAPDYARIFAERAQRRQIIQLADRMTESAYDVGASWVPDEVPRQLDAAEQGLIQIANRIERPPEPSKVEMIDGALENLRRGVSRGLPVGLNCIDRGFGGVAAGHLGLVGARTHRGKTAFLTQMALHNAKAGYKVAFFSLEQPAEEMYLRAAGHLGQVDTFIPSRQSAPRVFSRNEWEQLLQARDSLTKWPIEIRYRPGMRPQQLRLECRQLGRQMGKLDLIVIDYLGLMNADSRRGEPWQQGREKVLARKAMAGDLDVAVVAAVQLNREVGEEAKPTLASLRESGAGEEHSSYVLFLWGAQDNPTPTAYQDVNLTVAKQRNGPSGWTKTVKFKRCWTMFRDPDEQSREN